MCSEPVVLSTVPKRNVILLVASEHIRRGARIDILGKITEHLSETTGFEHFAQTGCNLEPPFGAHLGGGQKTTRQSQEHKTPIIIVLSQRVLLKFAAAASPPNAPRFATLLGPRSQNAINIVVWAVPSLEIRQERGSKKGLLCPPPRGTF